VIEAWIALTHVVKEIFEVEVSLRPTVSGPVRLGVRHPSGTRGQFFFLLEISFRQLRVLYFVTPSLTRERVCNLLYNCFWAFPEQNSRPYFTVSSETPPAWRARSLYLYPPGTGGPVIRPDTEFPFYRLLRLAGQRWRHSNPPPHRVEYFKPFTLHNIATRFQGKAWVAVVGGSRSDRCLQREGRRVPGNKATRQQ
jgi:hypothetical protein